MARLKLKESVLSDQQLHAIWRQTPSGFTLPKIDNTRFLPWRCRWYECAASGIELHAFVVRVVLDVLRRLALEPLAQTSLR